jgi:hypothetical protein
VQDVKQLEMDATFDVVVAGYLLNYAHTYLTITNYHLSIEAHEEALKAAGFRQVTWHDPELSTEILDESARQYWADFLEHPPIVFIECVK